MKIKYIPYCTGHYRLEWAKKKAQELRKQFRSVKLGAYCTENKEKYCKIYVSTEQLI